MTSLNDVDLEAKKVTAYSATAAGLAEMRKRFDTQLIPAEVTEGNYPMVKEAATKLQKLRTGLDKRRKEVKAPYKEAVDLIDGQARELTAEIKEVEDPWKAAKTEYDERAKRKEEARQAKIEEVFSCLRAVRDNAYTMDSTELAQALETLNGETCEGAMERVSEALELRNQIISTVGDLYAQKIDQERAEAENARLRAEKEEMERKLAAAEQQAKADREAAAVHSSNNTQLIREPSNSTRVEREPRLSEYQRGYIDALQAFAHWKDGTQYVGTSGKKLEQAIKEFMEEPAASNF